MGSLQVCAGHEAGCETLIHAMRTVYEELSAETVLLVAASNAFSSVNRNAFLHNVEIICPSDASNAFNSVNRNAFLHNVEIICPSIARYVKNCYSLSNRLFIVGGEEIQSMEGTFQGDPAAMEIYAIAIVPMILMLVDISLQRNYNNFTTAYADDLTAVAPIHRLKKWWETWSKIWLLS